MLNTLIFSVLTKKKQSDLSPNEWVGDQKTLIFFIGKA